MRQSCRESTVEVQRPHAAVCGTISVRQPPCVHMYRRLLPRGLHNQQGGEAGQSGVLRYGRGRSGSGGSCACVWSLAIRDSGDKCYQIVMYYAAYPQGGILNTWAPVLINDDQERVELTMNTCTIIVEFPTLDAVSMGIRLDT